LRTVFLSKARQKTTSTVRLLRLSRNIRGVAGYISQYKIANKIDFPVTVMLASAKIEKQ